MTKLQKILIGIVALVIVFALGWYVHSPSKKVGEVAGLGVPSVYDNVNLTGALQEGVTVSNPLVFPTYGNGSITSTGEIYAGIGFQQGGYELLNATGTAYQLAPTDLGIYSTVGFVATTSTTITLPSAGAMSTLTNFLLNTGDRADWVLINASSTGGTLTLAAGSGFNLLTNVASTTQNKVILASSTAYLQIIKTGPSSYQATVDVYR